MAKVPNIPPKHIVPNLLAAGVEWFQRLISVVNAHDDDLDTKISIIPGATAEHFPWFDSNGNIEDSGKAAPAGEVVGTTDTQTLTKKTLTKPTIGDFTNAAHDHGDAAGGGDLAGTDGSLTCIVSLRTLLSTGVLQYRTQLVTVDHGGLVTTIGTASSWATVPSV